MSNDDRLARTRIKNVAEDEGISIEALAAKTDSELLYTPGLGRKMLAYLREHYVGPGSVFEAIEERVEARARVQVRRLIASGRVPAHLIETVQRVYLAVYPQFCRAMSREAHLGVSGDVQRATVAALMLQMFSESIVTTVPLDEASMEASRFYLLIGKLLAHEAAAADWGSYYEQAYRAGEADDAATEER